VDSGPGFPPFRASQWIVPMQALIVMTRRIAAYESLVARRIH